MKRILLCAVSSFMLLCNSAWAQDITINDDDLSDVAASQWMNLFPNANENDALRATSPELSQSIDRALDCLESKGLGADRNGGALINQRNKLNIVFRIKKLKGHEKKKTNSCLNDSDFRAVRSRFGLDDLNQAQEAVSEALSDAGISASAGFEFGKDRVLVIVAKEDFVAANHIVRQLRKTHKSLRLRKGVVEQRVPTAGVAIYGHFPTLDCTTGYSIRHTPTGRNGISSAGHCRNTSFSFTNSSTQVFQSELDYVLNTDLQWYTSEGTGEVPDNYFPVVAATLGSQNAFAVRSTRPSNLLTGNSIVCKDGRITGSTCGIFRGYANVSNPTGTRSARLPYAEIANATSLQQFASEGDSGGPVYLYDSTGYIALGGVSARSNVVNGRMYFSPVETYANLGLQILTQP